MPDQLITLALVDDHKLFRKGLMGLIEMVCTQCTVLFEADNGHDLQKKLDPAALPEIVLLDVNMPGMDGFATIQWLSDHHPQIKVLVVSMVEKEESIIRMLKLGAKGYLSKDVEPDELRNALNAVADKGFYYTDFITGKLIHSLQQNNNNTPPPPDLNDREKEFLQHACSDFTYQQIANKMFLSIKTIDGYRNALFEKFNVKSRTGLALYAVRHGLVSLDY